MRSIPEGMMEVWASGEMKEPIEGVRFSNEGVQLGFALFVKREDWEDAQSVLNQQVEQLKRVYHEKLKTALTDTRNDVMDNLRIELSEQYDSQLEKAQKEIIKLKEQINGI